MSKSNIQLHPNAKSKHNENKQSLKKLDKLAQKYSWLVIGIFAVSTVVLLSSVVSNIGSNVGQAALNLTGYNSWKTTFGLNPSIADANFNLSGDGITNYNKFTLNQNLRTVFDGSVIPEAVPSSTNVASLPTVNGSTTVANRTLEATAPTINATTNTNTSIPTVGTSTSLTPSTLNPSGPALTNPTPSAGTTTTSPSTATATVTNPTGTGGSTAIPLPIPGSGSTGIVASTVNTTSGSTAAGTTTSTLATQSNPTVATSGTSVNPNINLTAGANSTTNLSTETVRTGGETDFIIFTAAVISLFTGIYLLKNKFTKNSLAVHQGEKSGKS